MTITAMDEGIITSLFNNFAHEIAQGILGIDGVECSLFLCETRVLNTNPKVII